MKFTLRECMFIYLAISLPFLSKLKQAKKTQDSMSSLHYLQLPPIHITPLILLLLTASLIPHTTLSQNPGAAGTSPPGPTMADCGPRLIPLVPCGPFVQGRIPSPAQPCCDGLRQLNNQQPSCLCLLLNNNTNGLSSFPINSTLALQLPLLCNLQFDTSLCSGVKAPSSSPAAQVSPGGLPNASIADSPAVTVAPKTSIMGFGFGRSGSTKLKMKGYVMAVLVAAVAFVLLEVRLSPS